MKILKPVALFLCMIMLVTPVLSAESDTIEDVVRLGRYSSKIDPEKGFREDCVLVSTYPVKNEDNTERELTVADFPNLSLSDVKRISIDREMYTDTYALYLKETGRRQVVEAIIALEKDLGVLEEYLCHDRVFPFYAISPWYDGLEPDESFTNINVERDPIGRYWVEDAVVIFAFNEKPAVDPVEHPGEIFPGIEVKSVSNDGYLYYYGLGEYTWKAELVTRSEGPLAEWEVIYEALKVLNDREDVKKAFAETYGVGSNTEATYSKTDYSKDDWFYPFVRYVQRYNWMTSESSIYTFVTVSGYDHWGTLYSFYPNMSLTRGMLVTVLYRMAGTPAVEGSTDFVDVDSAKWYADAVAWAVDKGLTVGVGGKYFAPERTVTREEFAAFMYRYHTMINASPVRYSCDSDSFADGNALSSWAEEAMSWAVGNLLFVGRDGGLLAPTSAITRAECAKVLATYDDCVPKK
ncbi:MAG: S-layer homology domain-containing protein [Clostridia bacterium]|nr:S-layer homology domain-containing protein [Clostridia bacterium]